MNAFLGPQFVRTHCGRAPPPPPQLVIGVRVIGLEPAPTHTAAHCSPLTREADTRTLDHGSDTADTPPAPARPRREEFELCHFPSLLLTSQFPGPSVRGDQTQDGGLNLEHRKISELNKVGLQNVITLSERAGLGCGGNTLT